MKPFDGVDFYRLDDLLTDEEKLVRDTVRDWVEERVPARSSRSTTRTAPSRAS